MKTKENFWIKVNTWFTISRVLITLWNSIAFSYHVFIIGFDSGASSLIQITALMTEYLVSGPYERMLVWSNKKINETSIKNPQSLVLMSKFFIKSSVFMCIFTLVYYTTYYIRLELFRLIHFGVNDQQLTQAMTNMMWFTILAGPIMGFIVIWRKTKIANK